MTICTSNADKAALLAACLGELGVDARHAALELVEPQADTLAAVARAKAAAAFARLGGPVLVEDSGIAIDELGGFPGPYTRYALATIGARGLVALAAGRPCRFASALALADTGGAIAVGEHGLAGAIAAAVAGTCAGAWSDLWRVFVPAGEARAFADLDAAARGALLASWRGQLVGWLRATLA